MTSSFCPSFSSFSSVLFSTPRSDLYIHTWELCTKDPTFITPITYDQRHWKIRDPVRSPLDKPATAGLVVGSVTTSESPVLYVYIISSPVAQLASASDC